MASKSISLPDDYIYNIKQRSSTRYLIGYIIRFVINLKYSFYRSVARLRGATIGESVILNWNLARKANKNLFIGDDTICDAYALDLRGKIVIKNNCIINKQVQILRVSHYIDDNRSFSTRYYPTLVIEPYTWLCTGCHVLPNVIRIASGSVISAFSTLTHNTSEMDVIGFDGQTLRKHNTKFDKIVISSLCGGDFKYYKLARSL